MSAAGKARCKDNAGSHTGFVYCDKASKKSADSCPLIEFADPVEMKLKGKSGATLAYSPSLARNVGSRVMKNEALDEMEYIDSGMSFGGRLRDILDHVEDMLEEGELESASREVEKGASAITVVEERQGGEAKAGGEDATADAAGAEPRIDQENKSGASSVSAMSRIRSTSQALFTSTVVVSGDTGSGKSRLLRHAVHDIMRERKVYISPIIPAVETSKFGLQGLIEQSLIEKKAGGPSSSGITSNLPCPRGTFEDRDITMFFGVTAALELSKGAKVWARVFQQLIQPTLNASDEQMAPFTALEDALARQEFAFAEEADEACKEVELQCIVNAIGLHQRNSPVIVVLDECQGFSDRDWDHTLAIVKHFEKQCKFLMLIACRPLQSRKYKPNFRDPSPCYE